MFTRKCSTVAAVVALSTATAMACELLHGDAAGMDAKSVLGDGGYTTINSTGPTGKYNMTLLSQLTLTQMGGGAGSSMWGWVDPATNREYAIMGRSTATSFVDVTNPKSPQIVATLPRITGTSSTSWREPKVIGNHVYIGVDGANSGIQVMDLTRLRNYAGTTMTMTSDAIYGWTGAGTTTNLLTRAHTLAINTMGGYSNDPFLYVAGSNMQGGGIHAINVSNPLTPTFAGGFAADGYTHEMQVVTYNGPDTAYTGKQIALSYNTDTLTIVDVTNKSAMAQLGRTEEPLRAGVGERRYVHQGWFTPDQKYIISNDELDEVPSSGGTRNTRTHFWNVQDLNNPVYMGAYTHTGVNVDHNLYIVGDLVFQSNYTQGLKVFKIGDIENNPDPQTWLTPIAGLDTYGANDGNSFNGLWNNYPFFPSGNIALADINGGLIMARLSEKGIPLADPESWPLGMSAHQLLSSYNTAAYAAYRGTVPEPASLGAIGVAAALVLRRRR